MAVLSEGRLAPGPRRINAKEFAGLLKRWIVRECRLQPCDPIGALRGFAVGNPLDASSERGANRLEYLFGILQWHACQRDKYRDPACLLRADVLRGVSFRRVDVGAAIISTTDISPCYNIRSSPAPNPNRFDPLSIDTPSLVLSQQSELAAEEIGSTQHLIGGRGRGGVSVGTYDRNLA